MAFTDKEVEKIKNEMDSFIEKRRPPENIRNQVDLFFKFDKQSIVIYEIRKRFQRDDMIDIPIAKATYVMKAKKWKIYWQRADLKWHLYKPKQEVTAIKEFIRVVDEDRHGCFWG
ncbi:MAG: hypothetical protein BWY26_01248 [Elusimicrobia bacterium ADurb.Bin231]|nr:MAG: hypothetical protein BWY26_01248 [Elusimicrobia bacterium ADurb.Bin231]